ncbi:MAG: hypothetical protein GY755_02635 [Chloroflexi bacterium]|nr:hypothetical protein [Chloroflexota bacterium]
MKFPKLASIFLITSLILITMQTQPAHAATGPLCYVKVGASGAGNS